MTSVKNHANNCNLILQGASEGFQFCVRSTKNGQKSVATVLVRRPFTVPFQIYFNTISLTEQRVNRTKPTRPRSHLATGKPPFQHPSYHQPSCIRTMWCIQRARPHLFHLIAIEQQRTFAVVGRKSKNVAAKKNKQDAVRTKLFTRLGVKILLAAKRGGTDPTSNIDLARALKEANSASLPKENIERALKKATDAATGSGTLPPLSILSLLCLSHPPTNLLIMLLFTARFTTIPTKEEYTPGDYEVFGLGGVGIIVRTLTGNRQLPLLSLVHNIYPPPLPSYHPKLLFSSENTNRAVAEIKSVARKQDVKMASAGSVLFQFELRGIIDVTSEVAMKKIWNEAVVFDLALACGVDDADWIAGTHTPNEVPRTTHFLMLFLLF